MEHGQRRQTRRQTRRTLIDFRRIPSVFEQPNGRAQTGQTVAHERFRSSLNEQRGRDERLSNHRSSVRRFVGLSVQAPLVDTGPLKLSRASHRHVIVSLRVPSAVQDVPAARNFYRDIPADLPRLARCQRCEGGKSPALNQVLSVRKPDRCNELVLQTRRKC